MTEAGAPGAGPVWMREGFWISAAAVVWIGAMAANVVLERATGAGVPLCMFKRMTGVPCATCGSTRAAGALVQGRVLEAVEWNPLVVLGAGTIVVWAIVRLMRGPRPRPMSGGVRAALWIGLIAAVAGNWWYVIQRGN